jgi:hypothetical protein
MTKKIKKSKQKNKRSFNIQLDEKEKTLIWMFVWVAIVFVIVIGGYFASVQMKKFTYAGIQFNKEKYGDLNLFHGRFPVIYQGKLYSYYNFYLRTDPRTNNISVNTEIILSKNVSVSLEKNASKCLTVMGAQMEFGKFVGVFPWVEQVNSGVFDKDIANATDLTRITCDDASFDQSVYIVRASETASIEAGEKPNCFYLNVGNCQNIETVERFIVASIAQINNKTIN